MTPAEIRLMLEHPEWTDEQAAEALQTLRGLAKLMIDAYIREKRGEGRRGQTHRGIELEDTE